MSANKKKNKIKYRRESVAVDYPPKKFSIIGGIDLSQMKERQQN